VLAELATTAGAALKHADRRKHALREVRARVRGLVRRLDAHDGYTAGHSSEVVGWSCALGERLRLSLPDLLELELGALLHDIGKVRVPDDVLGKPGPLSPTERELVNRHPVWGAELIERVPGLEPVATIVRFHHERWDGSGYPDGLRRDRIPVASRIVAVCDAYQAMTSARPYRPALPPAAAAHELRAGAGTQFDPALVDCFVQVLKERRWPLSPPGEREVLEAGGVR
jgi:HD-GYP domain-containing protein (c-di-GMP phosphodiesterase class II)